MIRPQGAAVPATVAPDTSRRCRQKQQPGTIPSTLEAVPGSATPGDSSGDETEGEGLKCRGVLRSGRRHRDVVVVREYEANPERAAAALARLLVTHMRPATASSGAPQIGRAGPGGGEGVSDA